MGYNKNTWTVYDDAIPDIQQPNSFITKAKLDHIEKGIESAITELLIGEVSEGFEAKCEIFQDSDDPTIKRLNMIIPRKVSWIFSEKELDQKQKTFNGLSAREWASLSRSVWNDVSSVRGSSQLLHGATYPEKLCRRVISMYTKIGDTVLDPFLGTGSTINATIQTKRNGIGIELTQKYYETIEDVINENL